MSSRPCACVDRLENGSTMKGKNFFERVYALVALIPRGKVMTYGQVGEVLHSPYSAKVVGYAMSCAPAERDLPCHRVVNRKGEMAPGLIFGGASRQRAQLLSEGVIFRENGVIVLSVSLWRPEPGLLDDAAGDEEDGAEDDGWPNPAS